MGRNNLNDRQDWIDTAKFIGMYAIYLGHLGGVAGPSFNFVFGFHVPLFFFLSGCTENISKELNFSRYALKKARNLLLPWLIGGLICIAINMIVNSFNQGQLIDQLIVLFRGTIRNRFFAPEYWFLTALFIVQITFWPLKKIDNKIIMLIASIIIWLFAQFCIKPHPISEPHMLFNIDSAAYYFLFYVLGYIFYPFICSWFKMDTKIKKGALILMGVLSSVYAFYFYSGINLEYKLSFLPQITFAIMPINIIILMLWVLIISYLMSGVMLFNCLGKESIWLCLNGWPVKVVLPYILSIFNLDCQPKNPFSAHIYTVIMMLFVVFIMVPFEKKMIISMKTRMKIREAM